MHKNNYEYDDCRIIHTSVLIETVDNKFAIGEMNECTAVPFKIQFISGGIDKESIREFITTDKRERDENLIATLETAVGIRPVSDYYGILN